MAVLGYTVRPCLSKAKSKSSDQSRPCVPGDPVKARRGPHNLGICPLPEDLCLFQQALRP